jgi:serine/threonine protein kinase
MEAVNICPNCCNAEMAGGTCPKCGYVRPETPELTHTLPLGKMLTDRYFIGKPLGEGGFGITYIGYDTRLNLRVAIKEYYPSAFANRSPDTHAIYSYSGEKEEYFKKCLDRFMNEAKRLAVFAGEPSIVTVRDCFLENGTAYIVMEYIDGDSLKTILSQVGRIDENTALEMIKPIIKTLAMMHKDNIIHRDIAPDNIMVEHGGTARLIDFGSATEQKNDGKSTIAMVKRGFAPPEQHDENHARHGTWTDVYSICATLYNIIEGEVPVDSVERLRGEKLKEFTAPVSERTKKAILNGLELSPEKRTQTMDELYKQLPDPKIKDDGPPPPPPPPPPLFKIIAGIAAAVVVVTVGGIVISNLASSPVIDPDPPVTTAESDTAPASETTSPPVPGDFGEKHYTYMPPSYAGLTLSESIETYSNGGSYTSSHLNESGGQAGFVIDYEPEKYLTISYTTDESSQVYKGRHPMIDLIITENNFGSVYIGESLDSKYSGEGYFFDDYNSSAFGWYTFVDGLRNGTGYRRDGNNVYIEEYEDDESVSEEVAPRETDANGNNTFILNEEAGLEFYVDSTEEVFRKNGVNEYFGYLELDGAKYRGQIVNGAIEGLGIYIWDSGDVLIAEFDNGVDYYGYLYESSTGKSYLTKVIDGKRKKIKEIEGINIDFNAFFGLN